MEDAQDAARHGEWLHLSQGFSGVIPPASLDALSYMHLAWSPNGEEIVYLSGKDGKSDIYTMTLDGKTVKQLTHTPNIRAYSPFWSPDATQLAIAFRPHNPLESLESDIFLINTDGSALKPLTD